MDPLKVKVKKKRRFFDFSRKQQVLRLVFLIHGTETKRALLPNEVTSLDTVRALFVRSFPDQLSMQWFDPNGARKIYVLDPATTVYYELEDLRDVRDRAVLKLVETDAPPGSALSLPGSPGPRSPRLQAEHLAVAAAATAAAASQLHGYESDSSTRSAPPGSIVPRSPGHHPHHLPHQSPLSPRPHGPETHMGGYATYGPTVGHTAPAHWSPTRRNHPHGQHFHPQPRSNQSSPQRSAPVQALPPSQRHSVAYLPDPSAYPDGRLPQSHSYHDYHDPPGSGRSSGSVTPTYADAAAKARIDKMEAQLANLTAWVQTTAIKGTDDGRPGSAQSRSNSSLVSDGSYSAKSSMSDVSSATPQPVISIEMQNTIRRLFSQARDLRSEVTKLKREQIFNLETMKETIHDTYKQLKDVINTVPGASELPVRAQRQAVNVQVTEFKDDSSRIYQDLHDLEASVEELRGDVLNKKCRVNLLEVENMALLLSNITRSLAELKARFPALQEGMKDVMQGEMQIVVHEEKYVKEEPERIELSLRRCKKLTGTLSTMKRLGMVQGHRSPAEVQVKPCDEMEEEDRLAVLEDIKALVPDHDARLQSAEATEASRERKKKITTTSDAMRFERSLATAQRQLRDPHKGAPGQPPRVLGCLEEERDSDKSNSEESPEKSSKTMAGSIALVATQANGGNVPVAAAVEGATMVTPTDAAVRVQSNAVLASPPAPQKPPRMMAHDGSPPGDIIDGGDSGVGPLGGSSAPGCNGMPPTRPGTLIPIVGFKVQTDSDRSDPNKPAAPAAGLPQGVTSPSQLQRPLSHILSPPSTTSTPKPQPPVSLTASAPAQKITSAPLKQPPATKPKKVPPPPPPRSSSRPRSETSPVGGNEQYPTLPHTYENIENLRSSGSKAGDVGAKSMLPRLQAGMQAKGERPKSASDIQTQQQQQQQQSMRAGNGTTGKAPGTRPKSQCSPTRAQQQALLAKCNLSPQELLDQPPRPAVHVSDVTGSDSGSSTTSLDSQQGTMKRADGRKMAPPPPMRKSSTLSTTPSAGDTLPPTSGKIAQPSPQGQGAITPTANPQQSPGVDGPTKAGGTRPSPRDGVTQGSKQQQTHYQTLQEVHKEQLLQKQLPNGPVVSGPAVKTHVNGGVATKTVRPTAAATKITPPSAGNKKLGKPFEETEIY